MSQKGFTLIEVLVSLTITSVTLIAISTSQLYAQQLARFALYEAQAYSLIRLMSGHIQSNPLAAYSGTFQQPAQQHPHCYQKSGCSHQEQALNALYSWQQQITESLPSGLGSVCPNDSPAGLYCNLKDNFLVLKILWKDASGEHSAYHYISF